MFRLVPGREGGALALGATRARAVFTVVLPAALPGIMTGILLALARIAGETAPLLLQAVQQPLLHDERDAADRVADGQVYTYAISPYKDWHRQAWAGALVLVGIVVVCSLLARVATARMERLAGRRGSSATECLNPLNPDVTTRTCARPMLRWGFKLWSRQLMTETTRRRGPNWQGRRQ